MQLIFIFLCQSRLLYKFILVKPDVIFWDYRHARGVGLLCRTFSLGLLTVWIQTLIVFVISVDSVYAVHLVQIWVATPICNVGEDWTISFMLMRVRMRLFWLQTLPFVEYLRWCVLFCWLLPHHCFRQDLVRVSFDTLGRVRLTVNFDVEWSRSFEGGVAFCPIDAEYINCLSALADEVLVPRIEVRVHVSSWFNGVELGFVLPIEGIVLIRCSNWSLLLFVAILILVLFPSIYRIEVATRLLYTIWLNYCWVLRVFLLERRVLRDAVA